MDPAMPPLRPIVAIVDDDAAMRKSLVRLLGATGYETVAFASAQEFLDSDASSRAQALVLDIHLEGMSGIELQRQLRADGSTLPVVFITAYDQEATRAEAVAAGCVAYLSKTLDPSRLQAALEKAFKT
jgi:FixJ family two-component response regulator